jgi:hypothetical protein
MRHLTRHERFWAIVLVCWLVARGLWLLFNYL